MEASWWERELWGRELGLLMGGAKLSKSLIQFSVDGWDCLPSLLFDLRLNYGRGNEDNGNLLQRWHGWTAILSVPNPAAGQDWLIPLLRYLDTHRQVWVCLLWGHCSFLLGPGVYKVLFVTSKSLLPQYCVSSGSSMVGLMATSSKRAYAIRGSAAPRAPSSAAVHCWNIPPQETLKHSSVSVSVVSLGTGLVPMGGAMSVNL